MGAPKPPESFLVRRFVAEFNGLRVKVNERFEEIDGVPGDFDSESILLYLRQTGRWMDRASHVTEALENMMQ
jgi:hypothetical protein